MTALWEELTLAALILNALSGGTFLPLLGAVLAGLLACGCVALWQAWRGRAGRKRRQALTPIAPADDPAWDQLWADLRAPDLHDVFEEER